MSLEKLMDEFPELFIEVYTGPTEEQIKARNIKIRKMLLKNTLTISAVIAVSSVLLFYFVDHQIGKIWPWILVVGFMFVEVFSFGGLSDSIEKYIKEIDYNEDIK